MHVHATQVPPSDPQRIASLGEKTVTRVQSLDQGKASYIAENWVPYARDGMSAQSLLSGVGRPSGLGGATMDYSWRKNKNRV